MTRKATWTTVPGAKVSTKKPQRRYVRSRTPKRASQEAKYRAWLVNHFWPDPFNRYCKACFIVTAKFPANIATEAHHTHGRRGSLLMFVPWIIAVCSRCHRWIDANRTKARERGLLCPLGQYNNPPPQTL